MDNPNRKRRLESEIKTANDLLVFSDAQLETFYSDKVDSMDEALAVLDETNKTTISQTKSFSGNKKGGS